jgi:hypothetical protein
MLIIRLTFDSNAVFRRVAASVFAELAEYRAMLARGTAAFYGLNAF